jgi:uncharacterized membrane protein YecN with MAPEG domain
VSTWAIAVCGCLYLLTAVDLYRDRQYGLALTFLAYAVGNIGLLIAARK